MHQWHLNTADPTPIGGTYIHFWGPVINNNADMAVYADINLGDGNYNSAWIVGHPGAWRKAMAFYDSIGGGTVNGQAVSRNPFRVLDDCGNLVAWCNIRMPDSSELDHLVVISPDGTVDVVGRKGDPTPIGGTFSSIQAWPSLSEFGDVTLSAGTPGAGSVYNAHFTSKIGNIPGDANDDGNVDFADFAEFTTCMAGIDTCAPQFACGVFDFDGDKDVDLADFAGFQAAFEMNP